MKKYINKSLAIVGFGLIASTSLHAATFYLQANMATNEDMTSESFWYTEPTGGTVMTLADSFAGNVFDSNGYIVRTENSGLGTQNFEGKFLVTKTRAASGPMELYTGTWNANGGMEINVAHYTRLRATTVNVNVTDMTLGAAGNLNFRAHTDTSKNLNLSVGNLSGSGVLSLGLYTGADADAAWNVSITNSTFTGTMYLHNGALTFGNDFALDDATLEINSAMLTSSVVLANSVSFGSVDFGATSVAAGTYTDTELNALLSTDKFSGAGSLTVVPEPSSFAMIAGMLAMLSLGIRRRTDHS